MRSLYFFFALFLSISSFSHALTENRVNPQYSFNGPTGMELVIENPTDVERLKSALKGDDSWYYRDYSVVGMSCHETWCYVRVSARTDIYRSYPRTAHLPRVVDWHFGQGGGPYRANVELIDSKESQLAGDLYDTLDLPTWTVRTESCTMEKKEFIDSQSIFKIFCQRQSCTDSEVPQAYCSVSIAEGADRMSGKAMTLADSPKGVIAERKPNVKRTGKESLIIPEFKAFQSQSGLTFSTLVAEGYPSEAEKICKGVGADWRPVSSEEIKALKNDILAIPEAVFGNQGVDYVSFRERDSMPIYFRFDFEVGGGYTNTVSQKSAIFCVQ